MDSFQSKEKPEVDTILTANFYFLKCKLEKNCEKTEGKNPAPRMTKATPKLEPELNPST